MEIKDGNPPSELNKKKLLTELFYFLSFNTTTMTSDQIENFLEQKKLTASPVQINFKTRNSIIGQFVHTNDYDELKSKNLWRIVGENSIKEFIKTKDINLVRIFNGIEFTRLAIPPSSPSKK